MFSVEMVRWNFSRFFSFTLDGGEIFYYNVFMANKCDDEGARLTILIWFYFLRFASAFVMFHAKKYKRLKGYANEQGFA